MATILVVDDEPSARKPLMKLLQQEGYDVIGAANAYEAMAMAKRGNPDLILLDVMIPPMDGLTFLMLLRSESRRDVPVFLLTGLDDENTVARGRGLGVKEHLVKGQVKPMELLRLVKQYLQPDPIASKGDGEGFKPST